MKNTIQDETEVLRWFEEGRTYAWMIQQYQEKYGISTSPTVWANFQRRHGLPRREQTGSLVPAHVREEHRWAYPAVMLRYETRYRNGDDLQKDEKKLLDAWKAYLENTGTVVSYDPALGFSYVPGRAGDDLIRHPENPASGPRPASS